jgi:hypothetical protein
MKIDNQRNTKNLSFVREFYQNCPVAMTKDGTVFVGRVVSVGEDEMQIAVAAHDSNDLLYYTITDFTADLVRKITREEYMLYRLKGWHLSNEIR